MDTKAKDEFKKDREVIEAATPGLWVETHDQDDSWVTAEHYDIAFEVSAVDAEFIARSRARWPAALDELDKANEQLAIVNQSYAEAAEAWRNNAVELAKERDAALAKVERVKEGIKAIIEPRRCSDGSCVWGPPVGMCTNGGCQALKVNSMEGRREIRALATELRALLNPDTPEVDHE
jgi:hypothetical protein